MRRFLLLLLALTSLSACGDPGDPAIEELRQEEGAIRRWEAPPNYSFRVQSSCGEQSFIGKFHIVVEDGEVADAKGLDESARAALEYTTDEVPTLTDLLRYAMEAQQAGADDVDVDYDQTDGHPTRIEFDYDTNAIDDESCFVITKYEA